MIVGVESGPHEEVAEDFLQFLEDDEAPLETEGKPPWLIAVVDDEPAVYEATKIALEGTSFEGRSFELIHARSKAEGHRLLATQKGIACVLLDVVMESEHAGLDLAREIRDDLDNKLIRIILRTGQPGYAPPMDVLQQYDINDYKEKTELTRTRLWMTIVCALRSYQQIVALELSRTGLRTVIEACSDLMRRRGLNDFARGVVMQIAAHLRLEPEGLLCARQTSSLDSPTVVGAAGHFAATVQHPLETVADPEAVQLINAALESGEDVLGEGGMTLAIGGQAWRGAIYLEGRRSISTLDRELLSIFCQNVSLGFENLHLFETVSELAYRDRVTKLATRARIVEIITERLEAGQRTTLMLADIDGFTLYSAAMGRGFGDDVLTAVANRLRQVLPMEDRVGCLVKDTFCLILEDEDPQQIARELKKPVMVRDQQLRVVLTYGCSASSEVGDQTALGSLQQAEVALKEAQCRHRGHMVVYSPDIEARQKYSLFLALELREAMESEQLSLVYQPQVYSNSFRPVGIEALLRWDHPTRGPISPSDFIPAAEASGLIGELGNWVVRRACAEMKDVLNSRAVERLAINLSPTQLNNPNCLRDIDDIVRAAGISPMYMEWEVTESAVLSGDVAISQLREARSKGYKIALDDFGTGYSSLSMIRSMPLDIVKIDRAFLAEIGTDLRASSIVAAISSICQSTGHETIAEGVETDDDLAAIQAAGIDVVQGFLFSRPLGAKACADWLTKHQNGRV